MQRLNRLVAGLGGAACVCIGACAADPDSTPEESRGAPGLHLRRATTHDHARAWVMLLPGASGLKVFDDDQHYFRAADRLVSLGVDVLVVDYKAVYRATQGRPRGTTGDKIAWAIERSADWMTSEGHADPGEPWAIVAWSLGAEGLWPLLESRGPGIGCRGAVAYYPSNEDRLALRTTVPLLILTGAKDDVTPADDTRTAVALAHSPLITLRVYESAMHGFDIESLSRPRTVELIPLIGPRATFGQDPVAATDAARRTDAFLTEILLDSAPRPVPGGS